MQTNFINNNIFNGGPNDISVYIKKKRYHVYYSEFKKCFWIWYNSSLVEITIPENVHHLVERSITK
jgi:nitrate/nitrite transporter NarK